MIFDLSLRLCVISSMLLDLQFLFIPLSKAIQAHHTNSTQYWIASVFSQDTPDSYSMHVAYHH